MAGDDSVIQMPSLRAVTSSPVPEVVERLEALLKQAKAAEIEFVAVVAMPTDGSHPQVSAAGNADPYRVIGALLKSASDLSS